MLSDRSLYSSLAYQGKARGLGMDRVERINREATRGLLPDLVVLLDLGVEEGIKRASKRAKEEIDSWTAFEKKGVEFHNEIRSGLLDLAQQEPERFFILDANLPVERLIHNATTRILKDIA